MSDRAGLIETLRNLVSGGLRQEEPRPVVVPATVEEAAGCLRAAHEFGFVVLPLGSGSSFPADFSLRRENVLAVSAARLAGMERLSPFDVRILAGTPTAAVLRAVDSPRHTLGGLVCDVLRGRGVLALDVLWRRLRRVELINNGGQITTLAGPLCGSAGDCALATLIVGSRGRLGMVTALEICGPVPIVAENEMASRSDSLPAGATGCAVTRTEVQRLADECGLFQW
jgi:FAD/FMN-containing dehydrogenase